MKLFISHPSSFAGMVFYISIKKSKNSQILQPVDPDSLLIAE